jgi:hypothetical protein
VWLLGWRVTCLLAYCSCSCSFLKRKKKIFLCGGKPHGKKKKLKFERIFFATGIVFFFVVVVACTTHTTANVALELDRLLAALADQLQRLLALVLHRDARDLANHVAHVHALLVTLRVLHN